MLNPRDPPVTGPDAGTTTPAPVANVTEGKKITHEIREDFSNISFFKIVFFEVH